MGAEIGHDKPTDVSEAVEHYTATTIPVHIDIKSKQVVLNLVEATRVLREARSIALGPCDCRHDKHEGEAPAETCLALNENADSSVETGNGFRRVTVEEALYALDASHQAGFVHLAYRKPGEDVTSFCSCCECCCWFLNALKSYTYRDAVVESSHVACQDPARCVACGRCVERCPFGAWSQPNDGSKPALRQEACFGCGLCATTCPVSAISFSPRAFQWGRAESAGATD